MSGKQYNMAIIGCGAVTEKKHLPVLAGVQNVTITTLVDPNRQRLETLGSQYGVKKLYTDASQIDEAIDIALLAVPHHLHAKIACQLIEEKGAHIFIEKPLEINMQDARRILETARKHDKKVGVGLVRRYYTSFRYVQEVLQQGWLGKISSFDFREGGVYNWPAASDTLFRKETGGGVLFDTGAHTLDMLLTWLGAFESVEYFDDSLTGVDANCLLNLKLKSGVSGVIELSRTRNLRNSCRICGENGELEVGVGPNGPVTLKTSNMELSGTPSNPSEAQLGPLELNKKQIEDFVDSIEACNEPPISAENAIESVRLFDACKSNVHYLERPHEKFIGDVDFEFFNGKTILVIGGAGFIGGRIVDAIKQNTKATVRIIARSYAGTSNLARYNDIQVVHGDVKDTEILEAAIKGCDLVFNCAHGKGSKEEQKLVNIDTAKSVITLAAKHNVKKVVHISTVSVYGNNTGDTLTEDSESKALKSDNYGYTKLLGEQAALNLGKVLGIPVTVIQPTIVYGPGAPTWTQNVIRMLKELKIPLIDGGKGICNAVYIDDLVNGTLRAAKEDAANGERFLISGSEAITWKEFYGAFGKILGFDSTEEISTEELNKILLRNKKQGTTFAQLKKMLKEEYSGNARIVTLPVIARFRDFVRSHIPRSMIEKAKAKVVGARSDKPGVIKQKPMYIPTEFQMQFYKLETKASIDKAARLLDYRPQINFSNGIENTRDWCEWANLL